MGSNLDTVDLGDFLADDVFLSYHSTCALSPDFELKCWGGGM